MAEGSTSGYRMMMIEDYNFARDEVRIAIIKRERDGYRKVKLTYSIDEEITSLDNSVVPLDDAYTTIPRELAELMLSVLAHHFVSVGSDLVNAMRDKDRQIARVTKQLEDLIAGIGRLGNNGKG